jgi:hypothetical protein
MTYRHRATRPATDRPVQGLVLSAVLAELRGLAGLGDLRASVHQNCLPDGRHTTRATIPRCSPGHREAPLSP